LLVSTQADAPAGKKSFQAGAAANPGSASFLEWLEQSVVEPAVEAATPPLTPSLGVPKKEGKQKKSSPDSPGFDAQAIADNPPLGLPCAPAAAGERLTLLDPAQSTSPTSTQLRPLAPTAVPVPASKAHVEPRVEWKNSRETGSSADLAFALRLKPFASAVKSAEDPSIPAGGPEVPLTLANAKAAIALPVPAKADGTPVPALHGPEVKSGGTSEGIPGKLPAIEAAMESAADPRSGSEGGGNHAGSQRTVSPDQPGKTSHEKAETRAPVEAASVHAQAQESRAAPPAQATNGPAVPEGPAAPKAAAQPAPAPAATSLAMEERPATARLAQEISLQISSGDDRKVDVRLVERAGEVHVIVRTPDVALAHELRQDLGSLTGKLAQGGYGTEQFTPLSAASSNLSDQRGTPDNQDSSRGHGQGPQHGGSGQQQQPQDERGKRPAWVEEMENSLARRQTNRSTSWLFNR